MEIGEQLIIGKMGEQPLPISDPSVSPQHCKITRTGQNSYQIVDMDSAKGVFVYGLRIERKSVEAKTPFLLGTYLTSVEQLLKDPTKVDLQSIWDEYYKQKQKWERYSSMINIIRYLSPLVVACLTPLFGQSIIITVGASVFTLLIARVATEKVRVKKDNHIHELNEKLKQTYLCPHCQKFLGFEPYHILKKNKYCPNAKVCGRQLP